MRSLLRLSPRQKLTNGNEPLELSHCLSGTVVLGKVLRGEFTVGTVTSKEGVLNFLEGHVLHIVLPTTVGYAATRILLLPYFDS